MKIKRLTCVVTLTLVSMLCLGCSNEVTLVNNADNDSEIVEIIETTTETYESKLEKEVVVVEEPKVVEETFNVNIKMVGDCLIHSPLYKAAKQEDGSYNFDMLFEHIKDDIESADLAIINQETIFVGDNSNLSSYPMFGSPTAVGDAEVKAGFDIIAHATNHTIDKGIQGILDTILFWETNYTDIKYLGIHKDAEDSDIEYITKNNINFAFVNYTYGLNGLESRRTGNEYLVDMLTDSGIEETLVEAEANSDLTVAVLHVGNEYVYKPTEYAQEQVDKFIDNGADIVICAHPHVVEPFELRTTANGNSGVVFYSLGNFVSNQDELPRLLGGMADINIVKTVKGEDEKVEITSFDMIPLVTHQERGYFTTYRLDEYTDELASKQKIGGVTVSKLTELWTSIINN